MRNRFDQQTVLGVKLIEDTPVLEKSRDDVPALIKALLAIYKTPEYNEQIFAILEDLIVKGKKRTGRKGLTLWQIFVLAQFRLALNLDYDRLHFMVSTNSALRQLMGIETETGFERIEIGYQRIIDNLHLLDETTLLKINDVVVSFGHKEVFKKKQGEALSVKTDSFVVETNVHFPTDYNLLWDSSRKALDVIEWFKKDQPQLKGWRKSQDWFKELKNLSRAMGVASRSGGKDKQKRVEAVTKKYLTKARAFKTKLNQFKDTFVTDSVVDAVKLVELERFIDLMDKHIDLVDRRLLKGEQIPHDEKLFSIFEQYTEWITKGKLRPNVELGKKVCISTDQHGLIIDGYIMENESDSQIVIPTSKRILSKYELASWSFDKGFWHKDNKDYLKEKIPQLIMPKKGKANKEEHQEQQAPEFKKQRNKHSAVESNINELEQCGLDRCPDRGLHGFKRYVAIAFVAYNLKRIGREMQRQEQLQKKKQNQKKKQEQRARQAA